MKTDKSMLICALAVSALCSCNLVTEFSSFNGGYSLKSELQTPVVVRLSGDQGSLDLSFGSALPEAEDSELLSLITDKIVTVDVSHGSGTSFSLTQGLKVSDTPNDMGEYSLALSADRKTLTIAFFNSFNGATVQAGEAYTALIEVIDENDFFEVGSLAITDVDVVAE